MQVAMSSCDGSVPSLEKLISSAYRENVAPHFCANASSSISIGRQIALAMVGLVGNPSGSDPSIVEKRLRKSATVDAIPVNRRNAAMRRVLIDGKKSFRSTETR